MRILPILFLLGVLFSATDAKADFYRWVDGDGKEYYTNNPDKIPPEYRDRAAAMETREDRVSIGEKPRGPVNPASVGREHRDKYGRGEEWWRRRAQNLRSQLADLMDEYDLLLKQEEERLGKEKNIIGKKKKSTSNFEKKKAKLEKKIAQAKRRLEFELPEDARKADAYPGWIRE